MNIKRTPFVAGNWKMYKTVAEARYLVSDMIVGLQTVQGVQKILCPPFTDLLTVRALLEGTDIGLGAQNMHWEASGAFTGEISPLMVAELCTHVIIGHSERRLYFGETDESVNRKIQAALDNKLVPILCVGETLQENEAGQTSAVVSRQMLKGLKGVILSDLASESADGQKDDIPLVVAYEPVWAIGTGRSATPRDANDVVSQVIRPALIEPCNESLARKIRVLYGGSVKAENAAEFFQQTDIDGALVGGASLTSEEFVAITQAAAVSYNNLYK